MVIIFIKKSIKSRIHFIHSDDVSSLRSTENNVVFGVSGLQKKQEKQTNLFAYILRAVR